MDHNHRDERGGIVTSAEWSDKGPSKFRIVQSLVANKPNRSDEIDIGFQSKGSTSIDIFLLARRTFFATRDQLSE